MSQALRYLPPVSFLYLFLFGRLALLPSFSISRSASSNTAFFLSPTSSVSSSAIHTRILVVHILSDYKVTPSGRRKLLHYFHSLHLHSPLFPTSSARPRSVPLSEDPMNRLYFAVHRTDEYIRLGFPDILYSALLLQSTAIITLSTKLLGERLTHKAYCPTWLHHSKVKT